MGGCKIFRGSTLRVGSRLWYVCMRVIDVDLLLVWGSYAQETHPERCLRRRRLGKCLCITPSPSPSRATCETGTLRANCAGTRAASSFRLTLKALVGRSCYELVVFTITHRKSPPTRRRPTSNTTFSDTPSVRQPVTTRSCTSVSHQSPRSQLQLANT